MHPDYFPRVSVLMPAYNHERFVEQAVRSVWNQTYKNLELIVIDDGSRDSTLKVLQELSRISPIPMQVHTQVNQGICKTLNRCFELSRGAWIALLASDDRYREDFVERMVSESALHPRNTTVLHCDAIGIDERGLGNIRLSKIRKIPPLTGDAFFAIATGSGFMVSSSMFISRTLMEKVGPYDANLKAEDFDIHLRLARTARFVFLDEPLFFARKVSGSLGSRRRVWSDDIFVALAKHKQFMGTRYAEIVTDRHKRLAVACYSDRDFTGALHHSRLSLGSTAWYVRTSTVLQLFFGFACQTPRTLLFALLPDASIRYVRTLKRKALSMAKKHA